MVLDIRPLLRGETTKLTFAYDIEPTLPSDVTSDGTTHVCGQITDDGGYMRLTMTADVPYATACSRCLTEVHTSVTVTLECTVATKGTLTPEQIEENVDEYIVVENGMLDADETLKEEILLCFPMRTLCDEDCPGLCPKCGKPKRDGDCGCSFEETNSQFAVLKDLFNNN